MTGKHYHWHKAWRRTGAGLQHDGGLVLEYDADLGGWVTDDETTEAWAAFEQARGVPLHDLPARLQRLCREAAEWDGRNP